MTGQQCLFFLKWKANQLGMPFYLVSISQSFAEAVFAVIKAVGILENVSTCFVHLD